MCRPAVQSGNAAQERLAYSYAGARRFAYNWAIRSVRENLATLVPQPPQITAGEVIAYKE